jgi:hypothetical protein
MKTARVGPAVVGAGHPTMPRGAGRPTAPQIACADPRHNDPAEGRCCDHRHHADVRALLLELWPSTDRRMATAVAHYLFNLVKRDAADGPTVRGLAAGFLDVGMWGVDEDVHRDAVSAGDLILIYLGSPERVFVGLAELASAVHDWTLSEAQSYPGDSSSGVLLAQVEQWGPPALMETVLSRIGPSETAKADFRAGVVRVTADECETAVAVAAGL